MKSEQNASQQGWRGVSWSDQHAAAGLRSQDNLQALEQAIIEDARAEAQQIVESAQDQAQVLFHEAEVQVKSEGDTILERANKEVETLRSQTAASARIEAQKIKLQRREALLRRVFAGVRERLAGAPQWPDYEQIVRHLVRDAVEHMDTDNALVRSDPETRKVLTSEVLADVASELGIYLRAGDPLERGTGVIVETPDGHRRYDNTLETRLARMQNGLRNTVYRILSGETP
jgi:vacuolar-type H+-ATPase subunit E/Vma4